MINYCDKNKLKLIVITHYCPTYKVMENCNKKDKYMSLYTSNLDEMLDKQKVNTWICGHTHTNFDFISDNGTRVVSNQFGKPKDNITDCLMNKIIKV
jgi:Icc-related predicted phosphoesterase